MRAAVPLFERSGAHAPPGHTTGATTTRMRLRFDRISRPVLIDDSHALLPALASVFRYWPHFQVEEDAAEEPVITIRPDDTGYRLHAEWQQEPLHYSDPVNLACGLALSVNRAMLQEHESDHCLHGAGIEIGGRLVVLPNYYRAGKSALTVCLAAAGARVFSDDLLPLLPDDSGMALGISPRLRLPLPDSLGRRSLRFVKDRRGAANKAYLYVELEPHEQAPFSDSQRFGGFVLLDRRDSGAAHLSPVSDAEVLKQLVLRNFVRKVPVETSLNRLHELVAGSACYKLTYANGDDAADLLVDRFRDADAQARQPKRTDRAVGVDPVPPETTAAGGRYARRKPGIGERQVGGDLFLVDDAGQAIYHLNAVGAGLWRLMDGSCGADEAIILLQQAFPKVERTDIERDVAALTADLLGRGLLQLQHDPTPGSET